MTETGDRDPSHVPSREASLPATKARDAHKHLRGPTLNKPALSSSARCMIPGAIVVGSETAGPLWAPERGSMGLMTTVGAEVPAQESGSMGLTMTPIVLGASRTGMRSTVG